MRLDADQVRARGVSLLLFLCAATALAACSRTWVLGGPLGAGGAGGPGAAGGGDASDAGGGGAGGMAGGMGGLSGQGGRNDMGGHGASSCQNPQYVKFDIPTSDMVFVVGRDQSMSTKFGDTTRMAAVQSAVYQAVFANNTAVNFGYQDFPSIDGCSDGSMCCPSSDYVVYAQPMSTAAINAALYHCNQSQPGMGCVAQSDSRPVSQTLSMVSGLFDSPPYPTNDRYVVLVTDGAPGCTTEDSSQACMNAQMAVSTLSRAGIKTYVVGVGGDAQDEPCLQQIALMGGTSTPLFDVTDPTSLSKALAQIVDVAASTSCTIELNQKIADVTLISVFLQGHEICFDPTGRDGWSYAPGSSVRIEMHGSACDSLQTLHARDVMIWSGCSPCTNTSGP